EITIGQTFSGGFIDFILFGVLQGNAKTHWMYVIVIGIVWFFLYYFTFKFLILKFNFKTPGRTDKLEVAESKEKPEGRALNIINALGGEENLVNVDNCATRLRVTVKDGTKVNEAQLQETGSKGVVIKGNGVQVIYGPQVTVIKNEVTELLGDE
ncbi:MAG: glucose PTS transporter subunit EIIB, partial [Carnobacterium sp.]